MPWPCGPFDVWWNKESLYPRTLHLCRLLRPPGFGILNPGQSVVQYLHRRRFAACGARAFGTGPLVRTAVLDPPGGRVVRGLIRQSDLRLSPGFQILDGPQEPGLARVGAKPRGR